MSLFRHVCLGALVLAVSSCASTQEADPVVGGTAARGASVRIDSLIDKESRDGHFSGSLLAVKGGEVVSDLHRGFSNVQFRVDIDRGTRFPIASLTKLFTAVSILQLEEDGLLDLDDPICRYLDVPSSACADVTVSDLLLHQSGLSNEPIAAYLSRYTIDEYIDNFVSRDPDLDRTRFNYNNVDYVLLSKIVETATGQDYDNAVQSSILDPLGLRDTGFVDESAVIDSLAYGYHNYTFGSGGPDDPLRNDRRFVSNYFGAGQMYSTTRDLYTFLSALRDDKVLSAESRVEYLERPHSEEWGDWLQGRSTYGFYYDDRTFAEPVLRRRGNIDGFNSYVITDIDFDDVLIILCNTDTGDLKRISNEAFGMLSQRSE